MRTIKQDVGVCRVNTQAQIINGDMITTIYLTISRSNVAVIRFRNGVLTSASADIYLPKTVQRECDMAEVGIVVVDFAPESFSTYHMLAWYKLAKKQWFSEHKSAKMAMFNYHYKRMGIYIDEPQADYDPSQYEYLPQ